MCPSSIMHFVVFFFSFQFIRWSQLARGAVPGKSVNCKTPVLFPIAKKVIALFLLASASIFRFVC